MGWVRRFIAWRKQYGRPPSRSATFNLVYDDPVAANPADFRLDICAAIDKSVEANEHGVVEKLIPAGRCARIRHVGPGSGLDALVRYLYAGWLPESGETLRDFPGFLHRFRFFPRYPGA